MCNKVDLGMECLTCGYPYCEAAFSDKEPPFPCDTPKKILREHLNKDESFLDPTKVEGEISR